MPTTDKKIIQERYVSKRKQSNIEEIKLLVHKDIKGTFLKLAHEKEALIRQTKDYYDERSVSRRARSEVFEDMMQQDAQQFELLNNTIALLRLELQKSLPFYLKNTPLDEDESLPEPIAQLNDNPTQLKQRLAKSERTVYEYQTKLDTLEKNTKSALQQLKERDDLNDRLQQIIDLQEQTISNLQKRLKEYNLPCEII